ncbi:hypothetical protein Phep_1680 [Pedobacter heparinus DSM 2366]|uniref:Uncharacterized protein n=2 Tax=Sphingobacteriaceae TaxID=84566 RepID=C6XUP1_PEDHD|nr:hypothetical protein Phep_1680 [Pedobacter heparinus DSM 2366]
MLNNHLNYIKMKTTYKISLSFVLINTLFLFSAANAQDKKAITAQQIIDGTAPGLKYGPKAQQKITTTDSEKEKAYKSGDFGTYIFTNYKSTAPQGLNKRSKQAGANATGSAKLPSDAPQPAQKEEKKSEAPKLPTQGE